MQDSRSELDSREQDRPSTSDDKRLRSSANAGRSTVSPGLNRAPIRPSPYQKPHAPSPFVVFVFHLLTFDNAVPTTMGRHKNNQSQRSSGERKEVPRPPRALTLQVPEPLTIRNEPTATDDERYCEEKHSRAGQLRTAQHLNWITIGLGVLSLFSLVVLFATLRQTQTAMEIDQRAWVGITGVEPLSLEHPQIRITFKNYGKTPALHIVQKANWKPVSPTEPFDPAAIIRADAPIPGMKVLTPDIPATLGQTLANPTPQQASDILSEHLIFCVFGELTYDDVFGKHHFLRFCLRSSPSAHGSFSAEHAYNDAD